MKPVVGIIMGSDSDLAVMQESANVLKQFEIPYEIGVYSAHRSPHRTHDYIVSARARGLQVIIAGAGSSAHLAGVTAAETTLPVIGIPDRQFTLIRVGFASVDRADAAWSSRGHDGRWEIRRSQRRHSGRANSGSERRDNHEEACGIQGAA